MGGLIRTTDTVPLLCDRVLLLSLAARDRERLMLNIASFLNIEATE